MNLEAERLRLIDISSEDDFLIDSQLDCLSLDLRLSVACETQNELVGSFGRAKLRADPCINKTVPLFAAKEHETFHVERENRCSFRKSLAWDRAFFTSPGFLELEELCLVNRGFKTEVPLLSESQEHIRSKVCHEGNSIHKPGVGAGSRQRTQSLMKLKLTSPSKMNSFQDSKQMHINSKRSEATSRIDLKSHAVQNATDRSVSLKLTRKTSQTRVSMMNTKKPPLKAVSNRQNASAERPGLAVCRRADSCGVGSLSSSQSLVSSIATSNSLDFSPYKSCTSDTWTGSLWGSQEIEGESLDATPQNSPCKEFNYDVKASQELNMEGHQNNQKCHHSPIDLRQNAARASRSPLSAETHRSPKPSSLRLPSHKIGFFEMKSGVPTSNDCSHPKNRLKDTKFKEVPQALLNRKAVPDDKDGTKTCGKGHRRRSQHNFVKQTDIHGMEEKENMFRPEDTVIELAAKKSSPTPSKLVANGSVKSTQCSLSSGNHLLKRGHQTMVGSPCTRIPFSTRCSPLKRSAFF